MRKEHREKMLDEAPETAFSEGQHSGARRIQKQTLGGLFSCDSKRLRLPRYLRRDSELTRSREIVGLAGFAVNVSQEGSFLRRVSASGLHPTQGVSELVSHGCEIGPGRG
jgi:hypothetical protein